MKVPLPTLPPLPPPPPPRGRGSSTSPQKRKLVLAGVARGLSNPRAAAVAGVPRRTVASWLERGQEHGSEGKSTWEVQFCTDHDEAQAKFIDGQTTLLLDAAQGDWRAHAWILERSDPERWGRHVKLEHTGPAGEPLGAIGPGNVTVNLIVSKPKGGEEQEEIPFTFQDAPPERI